MSKVNKITVSFKHTKRDTKLFNISDSQEEKSEFIKDAIEFYLLHHKKEEISICLDV